MGAARGASAAIGCTTDDCRHGAVAQRGAHAGRGKNSAAIRAAGGGARVARRAGPGRPALRPRGAPRRTARRPGGGATPVMQTATSRSPLPVEGGVVTLGADAECLHDSSASAQQAVASAPMTMVLKPRGFMVTSLQVHLRPVTERVKRNSG